ncbi:hypothetical protein [Chromobacterium subtsugae]|uniref:hypothetical protein n=1 Tax=Chromobacterium subtsugae TaxID=251747 RepID=UPI00069B3DC5|nr:hypothetical protein [Chromobacterium subtsugae]
MNELASIKRKAFLPAGGCKLPKACYRDLGFEMKPDSHGAACFVPGHCGLLLQDYHHPEFAANRMMHLLVENAAI